MLALAAGACSTVGLKTSLLLRAGACRMCAATCTVRVGHQDPNSFPLVWGRFHSSVPAAFGRVAALQHVCQPRQQFCLQNPLQSTWPVLLHCQHLIPECWPHLSLGFPKTFNACGTDRECKSSCCNFCQSPYTRCTSFFRAPELCPLPWSKCTCTHHVLATTCSNRMSKSNNSVTNRVAPN